VPYRRVLRHDPADQRAADEDRAEPNHPGGDREDDAERAELLGVLLDVRRHHQAGAANVQDLDDPGQEGAEDQAGPRDAPEEQHPGGDEPDRRDQRHLQEEPSQHRHHAVGTADEAQHPGHGLHARQPPKQPQETAAGAGDAADVRPLPHALVHPLDRAGEAGGGQQGQDDADDPGLGAHLVDGDLAGDVLVAGGPETGGVRELVDPGVHEVREERDQHDERRDQRQQALGGDQHAAVDELDPRELGDQPAEDGDPLDQVLGLVTPGLERRGQAPAERAHVHACLALPRRRIRQDGSSVGGAGGPPLTRCG